MTGVPAADRRDRAGLVTVGAGVAGFVASFLPYWGVSMHALGVRASASVTAWHSYAIVGMLLLLLATALAEVRAAHPAALPPALADRPYLAVAASAGLGTVLLVLRAFSYPHQSGLGMSVGVRWGGYLLFLCGIVQTVAALRASRAAGEQPARS